MLRRRPAPLAPLDRLPGANPTRQWIESMIAAGGPTAEEVERLCAAARDPSSRKWRERSAVCWYLRNAGGSESAREDVVASLCEVVDRARIDHNGRMARWVLRMLAAGLAVGVLAIPLVLIGEGSRSLAAVVQSIFFAISFGTAGVWLAAGPLALSQDKLDAARDDPPRLEAMHSLEALGCCGMLGTVARAVDDRVDEIRAWARRVFPEVVGRLTDAQYGNHGGAIPALIKLLEHKETSLALLALDALARIGDGRALAPMEKLSAKLRDTRWVIDAEAREALTAATERALPALRDRAWRERDVSRLVRPASPSARPDLHLVRPVGRTQQNTDALLVRPGEAPTADAPQESDAQQPAQAQTRR